ncbi:MAG: hypothetical protein ACE5HV_06305 [Acidobacteriota bacterium]
MSVRVARVGVFLIACALASISTLASAATSEALPQQAESPFATAAELTSFSQQVQHLKARITEIRDQGEPLGAEIDRRQTRIAGALARLQNMQRDNAVRGNTDTGVPSILADSLADLIAIQRLALRPGQGSVTDTMVSYPFAYRAEDGAETGALPTYLAVPEGSFALTRLHGWLRSEKAEIGDRFELSATEPVVVDGHDAIPRNAIFEGHIAQVQRARRRERGGMLELVVDRVHLPGGQDSDVRANVVDASPAHRGDRRAGSVSAGQCGVVGVALVALLSRSDTSEAPIVTETGSGSALIASRGKELVLPPGSLLQLRFRNDPSVTATWSPAPPLER